MGEYRGAELADVELTGPRLRLRRWQPDDAPAVHAALRHPSMARFLALPDPYTLQDAQDYVSRIGHEGRNDGSGLGSAVVERDGDRIVGAAMLRLGVAPTDAEVGFWIAPEAHGHGYAAEATRLLTEYGFRALGVHRVQLVCDTRNLASARTALAAGFTFEGIARDGVHSPTRGRVRAYSGDLARFARVAGDPDAPIEPIAPSIAALPAGGLGDGTIALRPIGPGDGDALYECEDDVAVGWGFTGQAADRDHWRRRAAQAGLDWLTGRVAPMAIVDTETGRLAGELTLRLPGPPQLGALGYTVHPQFRGRGYTTRALRLIVPWAFDAAGFARLELGAKTANVASQRSALAAGFLPDGVAQATLRNPDGTFSDEARFALVNPANPT